MKSDSNQMPEAGADKLNLAKRRWDKPIKQMDMSKLWYAVFEDGGGSQRKLNY